MTPVGALEVGGSHVSVAVVDRASGDQRGYARFALPSPTSLGSFLATVAEAVDGLGHLPRPTRWAVALPGPFDYAAGVGGRHPDGKLAGLAGIDLRAALTPILGSDTITFVNDAVAFALGCARDHPEARRLLALTLGSGIGSTFVEDGRVVLDERVPPGGEVYCLPSGTGTVESRFGPAALAAAHGVDSFRALAAYARTDPATALAVRAAFVGLADALAPWLRAFAPDTAICGGGACHAWDLFGGAFTEQLAAHAGQGLRVVPVTATEPVALRGAAAVAEPVQ